MQLKLIGVFPVTALLSRGLVKCAGSTGISAPFPKGNHTVVEDL